MQKVTREFIHAGRTGPGGWKKRQLEIIGVPWPPKQSGWIDRAVGAVISDTEAAEFLALGRLHQDQ